MNFVYIDSSNLLIEGMRLAAVVSGVAPNFSFANRHAAYDYQWRLDFRRLFQLAAGELHQVGRAALYASCAAGRPTTAWQAATRCGFEVVLHDRNLSNREKKIDTSLTADVIADSYERMRPGQDEVTLVAGDKDYVPAIQKLVKRGLSVHLLFWTHAARELKRCATTFVNLDPYLHHLALPVHA